MPLSAAEDRRESADKAIWLQAVAKLERGGEILRQPVAESGKTQVGVILQQLVAELPWGHTAVGKSRLMENQQG